ncbi:putative cytochrome P450 [Rosellinia necatrix]|uniref:Putative cytochrome P450 n=1 Tax=Rosellinia necatrix TaxID=77044 RepID=A0A1S8A791_ROSNE|nr:putative cytochrome P450 [Rosellinia necatrix]
MSILEIQVDLFLNPIFVTIVSLLLIFFRTPRTEPVYAQFKRFRSTWHSSKPIHKVIEDGYNEVNGQEPFVVSWWAKDYLILPSTYLKDIKQGGWSQLSFYRNISDAFHLHCSVGDLYSAPTAQRMPAIVQRGLNLHLAQMTPVIVEEIDFAFGSVIKSPSEWQEVTAMPLFSEVAHRIAARFLIGKELCRDEVFIKRSISMLQSMLVTALLTVKLPLGCCRSFLASPISLFHRWRLWQCTNMLLPVIESRIQENEGTSTKSEMDAIQWTLDLFPEISRDVDRRRFAHELLHNLWAGSAAPGGMITEVLYQLLLYREDFVAIKKEVESSYVEYGWSEGMINTLVLLDSFIRETNRLFPTGSVTAARTVLEKPFQFSDGLTLPVGTRFGFPAKAIQGSCKELADTKTFHGRRFLIPNTSGPSEMASSVQKRRGASSVDFSNLA